jgi:hypothetical protein
MLFYQDDPNPCAEPWIRGWKPEVVVMRAFWCAVAFMAVTIGVMIYTWFSRSVGLLYFVIGVWTIAPAIWFWWEYHFLFSAFGKNDPFGSAPPAGSGRIFDRFKYSQDIAKAVWAGVVAGLIAFAASDQLKPHDHCVLSATSGISCSP